MKLVDDVSVIWRRWSIRIVAAQVVLLGVYGAFAAAGLAPDIPNGWKLAVLGLFSVAALTVAPFQQKNLPPNG